MPAPIAVGSSLDPVYSRDYRLGDFLHILHPVLHLILWVISPSISQRKGSDVLLLF